MGIRESRSDIGSLMRNLYFRIADFFTHLKKRHKKSVIVERTAETAKSTNKELRYVERLSSGQINNYANKARLILIETAKRRTLITYDSLMYKLNCGPGRNLCGDIVRRVSEIEIAEGRPTLSAVVIRSDTRMVGGGFFGLPNTPDSIKRSNWEEWRNPQLSMEEQEYWHSELQKVYEYWQL
jgi:hypothetical protein